MFLEERVVRWAHQVYCEAANDLVETIEGDILYLDPPYNRRQYGANYHLLNTIALYDSFIPKGKTGVRQYKSSLFCKEKTARDALGKKLLPKLSSLIFLSVTIMKGCFLVQIWLQ